MIYFFLRYLLLATFLLTRIQNRYLSFLLYLLCFCLFSLWKKRTKYDVLVCLFAFLSVAGSLYYKEYRYASSSLQDSASFIGTGEIVASYSHEKYLVEIDDDIYIYESSHHYEP